MRLINIIKRDLIIIGILLILLLLFISLKLSFGAQIVCIDTGTLRAGINAVDDVVEIQEDDVELTGAGYNHFLVIQVEGVTKAQVLGVFNLSLVAKETDPNGVEYWYNDLAGDWYQVVNKPKYSFTVEDFTSLDIATLASGFVSVANKLTILGKVKDKIPLDPANSLTIKASLKTEFSTMNTVGAEEIP